MNRRLVAPAASIAAAVALACSTAARTEEPFANISMDEVERSIGTPGFHVFDANVPEIFEKHHLPGARHLKGAALGNVLPAEKDARLVFYCTSPS